MTTEVIGEARSMHVHYQRGCSALGVKLRKDHGGIEYEPTGIGGAYISIVSILHMWPSIVFRGLETAPKGLAYARNTQDTKLYSFRLRPGLLVAFSEAIPKENAVISSVDVLGKSGNVSICD